MELNMSSLEPSELVWMGSKYIIVMTQDGSFQVQDTNMTKDYGTYKEFETALIEAKSLETNDDL